MKFYLWLFTNSILNLLGLTAYSLINIVIWKESESFEVIFKFNFYILLSLLIISLFAGFFSIAVGIKQTFILSLGIRFFTYYFISNNLNQLDKSIETFAVLIGSYSAFSLTSLPLLTARIIESDSLVKYSAINQIFSNFGSIISPFLTAYLISNVGEKQSLDMMGKTTIILTVAFLLIGVSKKKKELYFFSLIFQIFTRVKIKSIAVLSFSLGLTSFMTWGIIDVLILDTFTDLVDWRNNKILLSFLAVLVAFLLRKIKPSEESKMMAISAIGALILGTTTVYLLNGLNNNSLIVFLIAQTIFFTIINIIFYGFMWHSFNEEENAEERIISYNVFKDFFLNLGQFSAASFLFFISSESVTLILVIVIILSLIPLTTLGFLKNLR